MLDKVKALQTEIESYSVSNSGELENFRLEFLSKNGKVQSMFKMMGKVPKEEKAAFCCSCRLASSVRHEKTKRCWY